MLAFVYLDNFMSNREVLGKINLRSIFNAAIRLIINLSRGNSQFAIKFNIESCVAPYCCVLLCGKLIHVTRVHSGVFYYKPKRCKEILKHLVYCF